MVYIPPMSIGDEQLRNQVIGEQCKACPVLTNVAAWQARITLRVETPYASGAEYDSTTHKYFREETFDARITSYGLDANGTKNLLVYRSNSAAELIPHHKIYKIEGQVDQAEIDRIKTKLAQPTKKAPAKKAAPTKASA